MPSNRREVRMIASLLVVLLTTFAPPPSSQAGPISDMIARRRVQQQMKPSVSNKVFSGKAFDGLSSGLGTASLKDRFKKRFAPKPGSIVTTDPFKHGMTDVIKTSR